MVEVADGLKMATGEVRSGVGLRRGEGSSSPSESWRQIRPGPVFLGGVFRHGAEQTHDHGQVEPSGSPADWGGRNIVNAAALLRLALESTVGQREFGASWHGDSSRAKAVDTRRDARSRRRRLPRHDRSGVSGHTTYAVECNTRDFTPVWSASRGQHAQRAADRRRWTVLSSRAPFRRHPRGGACRGLDVLRGARHD